jgi:2-polyprenyl-3-methyl-5-hydroxy-6-metoxy-1,4-benzoquinol methylase
MSHPEYNRLPSSVNEGIPQFVEDEMYVSTFGIQWMEHSKTQLDSHTGSTITRDRLIRMFGHLSFELDQKSILEAGCGAGRFTEILAESNSFVTAIDLSIAVVANQSNNGSKSNVRIARASILDLPFDYEQFDIVFCPGVVQHTPNPQESIKELYKHVKPGGWLVFDQYRYNLSTFLKTTWITRILLRRLTPNLGLRITDWLVDFWLPAHRKFSGNRFLEIILFRFSPITSHYASYPDLSEEDQIAWAKLNTHDNLTDFHKHFTRVSGLKRLLMELGSINQEYCIMPYTVEVRCQKPLKNTKGQRCDEPITIYRKGRGVVSG